VSEKKYHYQVPYERAVKAFAYAGYSYDKTRLLLNGMQFFFPIEGRGSLRSLWEKFFKEAKQHSTSSCFSSEIIAAEGIDPLFTWAILEDEWRKSKKGIFVEKVMEEIRDMNLRKMVETLLFLGYKEEKVQAAIWACHEGPIARWDVERIDFYRKFFWDAPSMLAPDWEEYFSHIDYKTREGRHVAILAGAKSATALLYELKLPLGISEDRILSRTFERCFMKGEDSQNSKDIALYTDRLVKLSKSLLDRSVGSNMNDEIAETLRRLNVESAPGDQSLKPISAEDLNGKFNFFTDDTQSESVLDAELDGFVNFDIDNVRKPVILDPKKKEKESSGSAG
jgi:hypothetical protein